MSLGLFSPPQTVRWRCGEHSLKPPLFFLSHQLSCWFDQELRFWSSVKGKLLFLDDSLPKQVKCGNSVKSLHKKNTYDELENNPTAKKHTKGSKMLFKLNTAAKVMRGFTFTNLLSK